MLINFEYKDRDFSAKTVLLLYIFKIYNVEELLHYVWKHKLLPLNDLLTTDGQEVEIINPGLENQNKEPGFLNAEVRIGNEVRTGNVEIYLRSSDIFRFRYKYDKAYDDVVLQVVNIVDCHCDAATGERLPQLQLDIPAGLILRYDTLCKSEDCPPCRRIIPQTDKQKVRSWMDMLVAERLEELEQQVEERLRQTNGNWEWALFITLARNFGFGMNDDTFETWARRIPLDKTGKHRDELFQIESIYLGMAGLLVDDALPRNAVADDYFRQLQKEFAYQCRLFSLECIMPYQQWKYPRLRLQNFPHVRLAALAWMYHKGHVTLSTLKDATMEENSLEALRHILMAETSEYWQNHIMFGTSLKKHSQRLGEGLQDRLIINTVVPVLYTYAVSHNNQVLREKVLSLLQLLPAEQSHIPRQWEECGLKIDNAGDCQALIQLKKQYCDRHDCLRCSFGYEYLSSRL